MLFRALVWRPLRRDLVRTALSVAAAALGVATVIAIRLANRSAVASFAAANEALAGGAGWVATGPTPISAAVLDRLAPLGAEADISPYLDRRVVDADDGDSVELLGVDLLAGAGRNGAPALTAPGRGTAAANELFVAGDFAQRHHLRAGSTLSLRIDGSRRTFTVAGVLPATATGPPDLAVADLATALALFEPATPGMAATFDGLRVALAPSARPAAVVAAVDAALPAPDFVETPAARSADANRMLAAFRANLAALAYVSLLVGVLLIYNTVSISVLRRRVAIGVVRALGATPAAVAGLFLAEGATLALAGGALGIVAGRLLGGAAVGVVGLTVSNLYGAVGLVAAHLDAADIAVGMLLALGAGLLAAWGPARQAAALAPADALRPETQEDVVRQRRGRLLAASAACGLLALGLGWWRPQTQVPWAGFACALAAVGAFALLAPALLRASLPPLANWFLRRGWASGGLAASGLAAALRRTAVLTVALATATGVMLGVAIMVASFRQTVAEWVGEQLRADVYVRSQAWSPDHPAPLSAAGVEAVAATPGLAGVAASRSIPWTLHGRPLALEVRWWIAPPAPGASALPDYRFLQAPAGGADAALAAGAVLISEPLARRLDLWRGESLNLSTPGGRANLPIGGVFYDYTSGGGIVVLSPALYRRWMQPTGALAPTQLELYAAAGVGSAALRRRLEARLPASLSVTDNVTLRAAVMRIFDQTFRITWALEAIALVVALLGAANSLLAVVLDRRREFAVLRLLGATPAQVRRLLLAEAALVGGLALGLGLALGGVLALVLMWVVNVESFGWSIA